MSNDKSSKKITSVSIRFRDAKKLDDIRKAARKEELSLNSFVVRTLAAAAAIVNKPTEK